MFFVYSSQKKLIKSFYIKRDCNALKTHSSNFSHKIVLGWNKQHHLCFGRLNNL